MADKEDRHIGDELEESNRQIDHIMNLAEQAGSFKDRHNKGDKADGKKGSSENGDPSSSSDDKTKKGNNQPESEKSSKSPKDTPNPSGYDGKNDGHSSRPSSSKPEEKSASSGTKDKAGASAGGGKNSGGLLGRLGNNNPAIRNAKRVAKLIKKLIKAIIKVFTFIFGGHVVLIVILCIILALLPLLILKAMVVEVCVQITKGVCEIYDDVFGIEGWDEMSTEEKREYCQDKVEDFFGDLMDELETDWQWFMDIGHRVFQFFDDITDDDTFLGDLFNKGSNWTYKQSVQIDAKRLQEDLSVLGEYTDNTTITLMMVMNKLRHLYEDVNTVINVNDLDEDTKKKYEDMMNIYTQVDTERYDGDDEDAKAQWNFFDEVNGADISGLLPLKNIPIVITGQENFVTMNGIPMGHIEGDKQYLDDCIVYNPYGNKRVNLSVATGSDYELLAHSAYIMACYSACTPYDEQSVDDLLMRMQDAMNRADSQTDKRDGIDNLCDYDVKFTEVYMGAVVPRLYQPYLYKKIGMTEGQVVTYSDWDDLTDEERNKYYTAYAEMYPDDINAQLKVRMIKGEEIDMSSDAQDSLEERVITFYTNSQKGYMLGKYNYSYYDPTVSTNTVLGMTRLDNEDETYELTVAKGWFDVNGDGEWSEDEEFPICMQSLQVHDDGGKYYYPDSFCVVTSDEKYCNINATPKSGLSVMEIPVEKLGFYIYGTYTEEYADTNSNPNGVPYSHTDWSAEFKRQYQQQDQLLSTLPDFDRENYIFRFQFPFTRVSSAYLDDYDSDDPTSGYVMCQRTTPLIGVNATESSSEYPALYNMGYVRVEYQKDSTGRIMKDDQGKPIILRRWDAQYNGGLLNGYQAWVYLSPEIQSRVSLREGELHETETNFNIFSFENWALDTTGVPQSGDPSRYISYTNKPFMYQSKMRYMISVNVTVIPRYMDYILDCLGYYPGSSIKHDLKIKYHYSLSGDAEEMDVDNKIGDHEMTQGELASGTYEAYMMLLGVKEEEVVGASPQVGSCPTFTYNEMMHILRNCQNADSTLPTRNQKYMVYIALCAAGHVMYEFGGDQPAGLDFEAWKKPINKNDSGNRMPYEYSGMDCSGFVSWVIKTAFKLDFHRFDTSSVLVFSGGTTTTEVRSGTATAYSSFGTVFTDSSQLKVGDFAVRRTYDKNGNLSGHAALYIGRNPDNTDEQLWIEMTRYMPTDSTDQVNGIRVFSSSDYGANRNAVYVRYSDLIPKEEVQWDVISPVYMMIPAKREIGYYDYTPTGVETWGNGDDLNAHEVQPRYPTMSDEEKEKSQELWNTMSEQDLSGMVIVLDPGHQAKANSETEDLAPWDNKQKAKVSAGTSGVHTGRPEYEVVLEIALKMKEKLESHGATVILTRTTNDVNISNIERAKIATSNNADVFIRLHCDNADNSSTRGIGVFVCSKSELADQKKWGDWLGTCLESTTGSKFRGTVSNTEYSGLNWATSVPSFLLEMGFMSNALDDALLSDSSYQDKICEGVVDFCWKMKTKSIHGG